MGAALGLLALAAGCVTPATERAASPAPIGPDAALLARPLWDFGGLRHTCDTGQSALRNDAAPLAAFFNGTPRQIAQRLAGAVGDPLANEPAFRSNYNGDPGVSLWTARGVIHITDPGHGGSMVFYEGGATKGWNGTASALRLATDLRLVPAPGLPWVEVPGGIAQSLGPWAAPGELSARAGLNHVVPRIEQGMAVLLRPWLATGNVTLATLASDRALAIATAFQACFLAANHLTNATSPLEVRLSSWNGTLAYSIRHWQRPAGNPRSPSCADAYAPVLVDAQTGFVLGHDWDGCYTMSGYTETGMRSEPIPFDCPRLFPTACTTRTNPGQTR